MVLRGSKTRPDKSLEEVSAQLDAAKKQLEVIEAKIEVAQRNAINSYQGLTPDDIESMSKQELVEWVTSLSDRVSTLENERDLATEKMSKSSAELQKILNQLICGGLAGATARTTVAPIDRVKILMQTAFLAGTGDKHTSIARTLKNILTEEGLQGFWRGNGVNCIRVAPYAATQFASYEKYKRVMLGDRDSLTIVQRLACGGLAGATATTFTHPLDVIRLRLSVNKDLVGIRGALKDILVENGVRSLYKGYIPTLLSLSPFIGINFAAFDTLKTYFLPKGVDKKNMGDHTVRVLGCGAAAGLFAQSICFPLDTIRRRMQMKGTNYKSVLHAVSEIATKEGVQGFYRGVVPNAIKIVPNNGIRFLAYEMLKSLMGMEASK